VSVQNQNELVSCRTVLLLESFPMSVQMTYQFLESRPGSNYRQLFFKGKKIRAEILYRATLGPEPRTPAEVAADFDVPAKAVKEAIHYCTHHEDLLREERTRVLEEIRTRGLDRPPPVAPASASAQ
jgi:uncharacterized protein (DUF433 family)